MSRAQMRPRCSSSNAASARERQPRVDVSGLAVDDLYVFGSGMDYRGYWRELGGIYGVEAEDVMTTLALIVGSGFERLGLEVVTRSPTKTPYGEPSSPVLTVAIGGARVACIAAPWRRSRARAARDQLSRQPLGARAARRAHVHRYQHRGRDRRRFVPGELAVPDQLIDYTHGRAATFGGAKAPRAAHRFHGAVRAGARAGGIAAAVADCGFAVRAGPTASRKGRGSRRRPRSSASHATVARWSA